MSNRNIVDVDFEENKYYTLEDVAKITNLTEAKISFYCTKLKSFLNIQSIGMYQIFSDTDVDNLKKIKNLETEKKMTIKEISEFLKNNKQEVLLKREEAEIDVSVLRVFTHILEAQNTKIEQVIDANQQLLNFIKENTLSNKLLTESTKSLKRDIEETVNKAIEEKTEHFDKSLDLKMNTLVSEIREEIKGSSYVSKEEIDKLFNKKSWFSKIFK